ncbi:MAG TPA: winged helix-turn-helix transcriptional regulator [Candidatus Paceibacterota bacterium]|nr:winged helix-turn-helix transcriptional regulator [Candidatus Paceibacterota bacterium]
MDKQELEMILHEGERYKTEFKEGINGIEKDIVAFANSSGGKILYLKLAKKETLEEFQEKFPEIVKNIKEGKEITREELINIFSESVSRELVEKVGSKLVENQIKILLLLKEKPSITKKQLSEILRISKIAVDKNIDKLKSLNLLKRVGPDKGGYWEVIEK